jgi:hypothetical protein
MFADSPIECRLRADHCGVACEGRRVQGLPRDKHDEAEEREESLNRVYTKRFRSLFFRTTPLLAVSKEFAKIAVAYVSNIPLVGMFGTSSRALIGIRGVLSPWLNKLLSHRRIHFH